MTDHTSADDRPIVSPDSVTQVIATMIRTAVLPGSHWTYESLANATGLKPRRLKSYVHEGKEPSMSAALSIMVVLGRGAVNQPLALIGYGGASPADDADRDCPLDSGITAMQQLGVFMAAAADKRICHMSEPEATKAADVVIMELMPFSSMGKAE